MNQLNDNYPDVFTFRLSSSVLERVDAGVEWLNDNLPDWRTVVNFDILDMSREENCILGQYHDAKYGDSSFDKIIHACFNDNVVRAVELGFLAPDFNYSELNQAWQVKLRKLNDHVEEAAG